MSALPPEVTDDLVAFQTSYIVFDVSDRTQIELAGADRLQLLHNFCTNDIKRLTHGMGCEAFLTNIKGKVVGHVFVFATESSLWLESVPNQSDSLIRHLDRYVIREDVSFHDRTSERGELFVTGPLAQQLLMLDDGIPVYGHVERPAVEGTLSIRRVDLLGQPGFLLSMPDSAKGATLEGLKTVGCRTGSAALFDSLRIAAGFPTYGIDITDETLAQEVARTPQSISFTKGCYLGQEPIARLDALGHTNRELRRLRFALDQKPQPGQSLVDAQTGADAGVLTSVAQYPTIDGETAAIGYLKTKYNKPGCQVAVPTTAVPLHGRVL